MNEELSASRLARTLGTAALLCVMLLSTAACVGDREDAVESTLDVVLDRGVMDLRHQGRYTRLRCTETGWNGGG